MAASGDFPCPACGAPVRAGALACKACGADERTGWASRGDAADEETLQEIDAPRPMDDEEYEEFLEEDLGGGTIRPARASRSGLLFVGLAVLAIAVLLAVLMSLGKRP